MKRSGLGWNLSWLRHPENSAATLKWATLSGKAGGALSLITDSIAEDPQKPCEYTNFQPLATKVLLSLMLFIVHGVLLAASLSLPSSPADPSSSWTARYFGGSPLVIGAFGPMTYLEERRYPGNLCSMSRCSWRYHLSKSASSAGSISMVTQKGGATGCCQQELLPGRKTGCVSTLTLVYLPSPFPSGS